MQQARKYRSVDIDLAVDKGWDVHHKLTHAENKVLGNIARHGAKGAGAARAWFPMDGQKGWAEDMAMPEGTLSRALLSLRKKGLVINVAPSGKYRGVKGYGIPERVFEECLEWVIARNQIKRGILKYEDGPLKYEDASSYLRMATPSDQGECVTKEVEKKEEETTNVARRSRAEDSMREEDPWDTPEKDDWARPSDPEPKRRVTPQYRLAEEFRRQGFRAREQNTHLPLVWDSQARVLANIKHMLSKEHDADTIGAMIEAFFIHLEGGGRYDFTRFDDLWSCFFAMRSAAYKDAQHQGEVPVDIPTNDEFFEKLMRRADKRDAEAGL